MKQEKELQSRREFLKKAGITLASSAAVLTACQPKAVETAVPTVPPTAVPPTAAPTYTPYPTPEPVTIEVEKELPAWPWTYVKLDTEEVRKRGHKEYYKADCGYGAFAGIIGTLQDQVGYPFTQIPMEIMGFGAGGVASWGTTCGALLGASAAINLFFEHDKARGIVSELLGWYSREPFPSEKSNQYAVNHEFLVEEYKSDLELPPSVSNSPLCHASVSQWCRASGYASGSKERAERCGRLTGDVAAKAVELLNANLDGSFAAIFKVSEETQGCSTCHTKGENYDLGNFAFSKMECTDCHEPHD